MSLRELWQLQPAQADIRRQCQERRTWTRDFATAQHSSTTFSTTMPPTMLPSPLRALSSLSSNPAGCLSLFAPRRQLPPQVRAASIFAGLSDVPAAYNKRIRRGRGPASGKGKTSGRGHKGQKQHGKVPVGFNGGQTPYEVTHPEKGFVNQYVSHLRCARLSLILILRQVLRGDEPAESGPFAAVDRPRPH